MSAPNIRGEHAAAFGLGLAIALASYQMDGWWLDSGAGVLHATIVLFGVAFVVALWRKGSPWAAGAALWLGAIIGMGGALFRTGPGTIWPIVLVVAGGITAGTAAAGVLVGVGVNRMRRSQMRQ